MEGTSTVSFRGRWVDVFDEQHLVALLVVNKIVDLLFREQEAKAAWPHALFFANGNVAKEIASRTVNGGVAKFLKRESLTGIFYAQRNGMTAANEGNLHIVARVEMPSVLHGVHKNLSKSRDHRFPCCVRKAGVFRRTKELYQPMSGFNIAASRQADPSGGPGEHFDSVIPARRLHC